jgi:hypothetical protein
MIRLIQKYHLYLMFLMNLNYLKYRLILKIQMSLNFRLIQMFLNFR